MSGISKKIFGWWFPQENPEWCNPAGQASSTKFRFIVYTLIHGLTVQHTTTLITATFPLPPLLLPQEEPQCCKWVGVNFKMQSKTFSWWLKKEVCTDLCVLLLVVNTTVASRKWDSTITSWYLESSFVVSSSSSHSTSCFTVATLYVCPIHMQSNQTWVSLHKTAVHNDQLRIIIT